MTDDDSQPTHGLIDARYEILECVGQGGMARVYRAKDTLLGRIVAIKLLRAELEGDDAAAGRARGEMSALASLNHPGLVTLYDAQLEPGRPEYLVMEYVEGPTLADRIGQGALAPADVAALTADLAEALHVVHSAGIVHRDIKPSNVLISQAPFPASRSGAKLADFGISALVDAARLTSPGIVIGTAAYIAPEQLQGAMPAPPADIYSLGLVMLEALTGTRAFPQPEGIGAAMARLTARPEVPTEFGSGWSDLLTAMTSTDPADRPTASDVFAAASDLAAGRPPRPTVPAAVAAGAVPPAAASTPDAESPTAAMTTPTRMLPAETSAARATGASSPTPPQAGRGSSRPRRRVGVIGAVAAAAVAASVLAGVWMNGSAAPEPVATTPADIGPSAPATPAVPAIAPDDEADEPQTDQRSDQDRKAQEKAAKEAEKAAQEQRKAAEKAAEEQRKAAEKAAEKARKDAEKAREEAEEAREEAEEAEENQEDEAEPTPEGGAGGATEGVTLSTPQPSASPTA
ncbi:serine/threonine-protein kinase [Microbacterium sp. OR16]|uniref:serine/threonine-protein kinase n=1 Tax=Microbacterium sp. OR16 TaxID=3095345 RepID=UPI0039B3C660